MVLFREVSAGISWFHDVNFCQLLQKNTFSEEIKKKLAELKSVALHSDYEEMSRSCDFLNCGF